MFPFDSDPNLWPSFGVFGGFVAGVGVFGLGFLLLAGAASGYPEELAIAGWFAGPLLMIGGVALFFWWWNSPTE